MIVALFINLVIGTLGVILSWLPTVDTLPIIFGYDVDAMLSTAISSFNGITTLFWPLAIVFQGFLVLMGYYILKITLKLFLGHRTPTHN